MNLKILPNRKIYFAPSVIAVRGQIYNISDGSEPKGVYARRVDNKDVLEENINLRPTQPLSEFC